MSQRHLGGRTSCARCSQLQPLSVQRRSRDAQPNRSKRARNARSNGEDTRLNRHLARRPAPSTARRHLIHECHSCARRCATTLLRCVKTTWIGRGDRVLNRWVFISVELICFLGQTTCTKERSDLITRIGVITRKKDTTLPNMEKLTRAPLWPDIWSMITSSPAFESSHQLPSNHRICGIVFLAKYAGIER